jgi:hypothetical protein
MATEDTSLRLSFYDSEVLRLTMAGDTLAVHFSAAWVERREAGMPPLTGYVRGLRMELLGVREPQLLAAVGRLRGGRLVQATQTWSQLDIPGSWQGPLTLELDFAQGAALQFRGTRLGCALQPDWEFQESLAC